MRKLVAAEFISLDGVAESPDQWQFDVFDADMGSAMEKQLAKQDAAMLGRVSYLEWASYWPTSTDEPFASYINSIPKYVVSTTLDKVGWGKYNNAMLIKGNLASEIDSLKRQAGKDIGISGSMTLVRSLLQDDLIDELILMIHPVIVGKGKHLFKDWSDLKRMKLVDSQVTGSGVAILTYQPRTA